MIVDQDIAIAAAAFLGLGIANYGIDMRVVVN
jgi:hypothetical protein